MSTLSVVGLGPGNPGGLTLDAKSALEKSEVLVGYTAYIDLVRGQYPDKEFLETGMRGESERCHAALQLAAAGRRVSVVCSGDAGVYGMAGLILELSKDYPPIDIEVVPGVTAALSGAARLGAPLTNDFAVISLSDLLTPWRKIEQRLRAVAAADLCAALYNPSSRTRADYLARAAAILLSGGKAPETLCGYVKNIGRPGEAARLCTLSALGAETVDMFTTVFIGNADTVEINGRMVTPRGYRL